MERKVSMDRKEQMDKIDGEKLTGVHKQEYMNKKIIRKELMDKINGQNEVDGQNKLAVRNA